VEERVATPPSEAEVLGYFESLSNWGRWGPDDQLGTLNHITPAKRQAAAALVREGVTVSCAWDIETTPQPDHAFGTPQRWMLSSGQGLEDSEPVIKPGRMSGAMEFIGLVYHGYAVTHVDGLSHIFWDRRMYNGVPASKVTTPLGATHHAITAVRDGVLTRGVLLDIAAARGKDWLEAGEGVFPEDLAAAEARQGVTVGEGDVVLLRTGYGRKKREAGRDPLPRVGHPGWHVACMPWLHERSVAMIGADTAQEVSPSGYSIGIPVHAVGITAMGLWLIDNCNLEELAAACERFGRWEFMFMLSPLRITGGTGSPANPLAVF
jgi:kynurenine formamidase